jgi:hypothetical protein
MVISCCDACYMGEINIMMWAKTTAGCRVGATLAVAFPAAA